MATPNTITVRVDADTVVTAIFEPELLPFDPQCPPAGTISIAGVCSGECKSTTTYHDGNCGFYTEQTSNINCCSQCPPANTLIKCVDTTAIYYTGQRDPVTFECLTTSRLNDPKCLVESPPISQTPVASPSPTPQPTPVIEITQRVYELPDPSPVPGPSVTPVASTIPVPTPTPSPVRWRSCVDGQLRDGTPPTAYRSANYQGAGGGICWEPSGDVGFEPDLGKALTFMYQRGSKELPQPQTIIAVNPSYAITYNVTLETNPSVTIQPRAFRLAPRGSQTFTVNVTPELLSQLGDGTSTLDLNIIIEQG